jgi:protein-tyrosine phosphatase
MSMDVAEHNAWGGHARMRFRAMLTSTGLLIDRGTWLVEEYLLGIEQGLVAIRAAVSRGERVAVHCGGGLGRTGTLLACYLVDRGLNDDEAIARVRATRTGSIETRGQVAAIEAFARCQRGS